MDGIRLTLVTLPLFRVSPYRSLSDGVDKGGRRRHIRRKF